MAEGFFNAAEQDSNLRELQRHIAAHKEGKALPGLAALLKAIGDGADVFLLLPDDDKKYFEANEQDMIAASKAALRKIEDANTAANAERMRRGHARACH